MNYYGIGMAKEEKRRKSKLNSIRTENNDNKNSNFFDKRKNNSK